MSEPFSWKNMLDSGMLDGPSLIERFNSKTKPPKKKSGTSKPGSGVSQYRYPRSYTDNKRDYLAITISNYTPEKRQADKKTAFTKTHKQLNQDNKETGRFKYKVTPGKLPLGTFSTFTDKFNKPGGGKKVHTYINLPIPEQLQDNNAVSWNEDTINPIEATGVNALSGMAEDPINMGGKVSALADYVKSGAWQNNSALQGINKELITKYLAAQAISKFSNVSPQAVITRTTGQVMQSNMELLVDRPSLRNFTDY